jgi:hypothetical protein
LQAVRCSFNAFFTLQTFFKVIIRDVSAFWAAHEAKPLCSLILMVAKPIVTESQHLYYCIYHPNKASII